MLSVASSSVSAGRSCCKLSVATHSNHTYSTAANTPHTGGLNQTELSGTIEPYIFTGPKLENLHNQLICGLFANIFREPPDAPVAPWVSANDKPTAAPKPPSGDPAEQSLKQEIMLLPPRVRHRIKSIRDVSIALVLWLRA